MAILELISDGGKALLGQPWNISLVPVALIVMSCLRSFSAIVPPCLGSAYVGLGIYQIPFYQKAIPWEAVFETNITFFSLTCEVCMS